MALSSMARRTAVLCIICRCEWSHGDGSLLHCLLDCMTFVNLPLRFHFFWRFFNSLGMHRCEWYLGCSPLSIYSRSCFALGNACSSFSSLMMITWLSAVPSPYRLRSSSGCRIRLKLSICGPKYACIIRVSWKSHNSWPSSPKDLALPKFVSNLSSWIYGTYRTLAIEQFYSLDNNALHEIKDENVKSLS